MANINFTCRYGTNPFDICSNTYGVLDLYIKMLNDNDIDNDFIPNGQVLTMDSSLVSDPNIYNETTANDVFFSTGIVGALGTLPPFRGGFNDGFDGGFQNQGS